MELAPVYDCGSSLFPQADETIMKEVLENSDELKFRVFEIPTSAIMLDGKKIRYFDFISSLQNEDCNKAVRRITSRIDMNRIKTIIEETPYLSNLQKEFYFTILSERKIRILDFTLKLLEQRKAKNKSKDRDVR
jgi:hypothetical protein